ncbi:MAG: HAD hydrolase-like protein [Candidatus Heimdallarchaeota archaeon]|nr:HAD hydrolase-like protein [Candidatus Heimdallarchaeota archaeon]
MNKTNLWEYAIFFDDGGVMNDNRLRGIQWQKMIGDYFSPKYGEEPYRWAEANFEFIEAFTTEYNEDIQESQKIEYNSFYDNFINRWISEMFEYVGVPPPAKNLYKEIYFDVIDWITPNVKSSFSGVSDTIKSLHNQGFKIYTASAEHSSELKGYLRGMRVKEYFTNFYGPDLINTHKTSELFYEKIFKDIGLNPRRAIVLDDNPKFLEYAKKLEANVIQVCLTGEHKPIFDNYIEQMIDLPEEVLKLIKKVKK